MLILFFPSETIFPDFLKGEVCPMKRDDAPELLVQFGPIKVLAKGLEAIQAIKRPMTIMLLAVAVLIFAIAIGWHTSGISFGFLRNWFSA